MSSLQWVQYSAAVGKDSVSFNLRRDSRIVQVPPTVALLEAPVLGGSLHFRGKRRFVGRSRTLAAPECPLSQNRLCR
jgi:hypothetical protein